MQALHDSFYGMSSYSENVAPDNLVSMQRREENRVAAFSQWTIAMYAWNKEEMQKGVAYPSKAFWNQLLVLPFLICFL